MWNTVYNLSLNLSLRVGSTDCEELSQFLICEEESGTLGAFRVVARCEVNKEMSQTVLWLFAEGSLLVHKQ